MASIDGHVIWRHLARRGNKLLRCGRKLAIEPHYREETETIPGGIVYCVVVSPTSMPSVDTTPQVVSTGVDLFGGVCGAKFYGKDSVVGIEVVKTDQETTNPVGRVPAQYYSTGGKAIIHHKITWDSTPHWFVYKSLYGRDTIEDEHKAQILKEAAPLLIDSEYDRSLSWGTLATVTKGPDGNLRVETNGSGSASIKEVKQPDETVTRYVPVSDDE